jgi:hypothetical protein
VVTRLEQFPHPCCGWLRLDFNLWRLPRADYPHMYLLHRSPNQCTGEVALDSYYEIRVDAYTKPANEPEPPGFPWQYPVTWLVNIPKQSCVVSP